MSEVKEKVAPEMKPVDIKASVPKSRPAVTAPRFKEAAVIRNAWSIVAEAGILPDDVLEKDYWRHIASNLRPGDRIEVLTDDMRWAGTLIVYASGRLWATVKFLDVVTFSDIPDESANDKLRVQYRGPHHRFCVVDFVVESSPQVIRTNFDNQEDAMIFLQEYRKTVRKVA